LREEKTKLIMEKKFEKRDADHVRKLNEKDEVA
jgi:hypothetical protein